MKHFIKIALIICISTLIFACGGGSSSSTRNDPSEFNINGVFVGLDNANRNANVAVDSTNKTIDIALTTSTDSFDIEGTIVLTSVASTGKKNATGDITYNVDLLITKSSIDGFVVGETSLGTIIKTVDDVNGNQYTCAFNFTNHATRGTETESDWSMSGTKAP